MRYSGWLIFLKGWRPPPLSDRLLSHEPTQPLRSSEAEQMIVLRLAPDTGDAAGTSNHIVL